MKSGSQLPTAHYWMKKYLKYFSSSLKRFPDKFIPLVFVGQPGNDRYLVYLCPICLTNSLLVDKEGYYESSPFSEDHFPPESAGGKLTILTCRTCNSTAGGTFENSLREKMEYISFDKKVPNSVIKARTVIDEVKGWRHGALSVSDTQETYFQLKITGKQKLPELSIEKRDTNNFGKGWKAEIFIPPIIHEKVKKALLKSAYLYCFYNWGYDFVFSQQGESIRKSFTGESIYPIEVGVLWFDFQTPIAAGKTIPEGLCFIEQPEDIQAMLVNIPMSLKSNGYKCIVPVLIPAPTTDGIEEIIRIQGIFEANPNKNISIGPVNNALLHGISDCYRRTWADLINSTLPIKNL